MNKPFVSVLLPICNVEKYLHQALDSVINQTLKNMEIICIDDGSTDSSSAICDEYAAKDPRVKVIHKANSGYGSSMNLGIASAAGEYIGIIEPDDFAELDMFEKLYDLAVKNDADVVKSDFFKYWSIPEEKNIKAGNLKKFKFHKVINAKSHPEILLITYPSIWTGLYKSDFLRENHIKLNETPGASFQDLSFHFMTFACAERVILTPEYFLHYRQDNENSSVKSSKKAYCVCDEIKYIETFLEQYPEIKRYVEEYKWAFQYKCYRRNLRRLSAEVYADFLEIFAEDFRKAMEKGILSTCFYRYISRKEIDSLVNEKKICQPVKPLEWIFSVKNIKLPQPAAGDVPATGAETVCVYKLITLFGIKIKIRK